MEMYSWLAFCVALLVSYLATPLVRRLAIRIGAVDQPNARKVHKSPIPRLGGLAIYLSFMAAILITLPLDAQIYGVLLGATLIVILGVIDDLVELSPKVKLIGQILAAAMLVVFDVRISNLTIPFEGMMFLGNITSSILTIIWVVGIVNTVNLIDGLDGLAAGTSAITAITLFLVGYQKGQFIAAILAMALMGSALGFLKYNFNPAKIFMGDTGSMFLGFMLAAISIEGALKSTTTLALVVPVLALGFPIFDTTIAIVRRSLNRVPIFQADKGHFHHKLVEKGLSHKQAVLVIYFICSILCGAAFFLAQANGREAVLTCLLVAGALVFIAKKLGMLEVKRGQTSKKLSA